MSIAIISLIICIPVLLVCLYIKTKRTETVKASISETKAIIHYECEDALKEVQSYYSDDHYLTDSERTYLNDKYRGLLRKIERLIKYYGTKEFENRSSIEQFYKFMTDSEKNKKINNENFVNNQLIQNKEYFDTVLSHPLDHQQRESVVTLEDNCLVISSAGSGKTMTTVGKVRYLIDKQHVDPSKILLITFTRKAAESLSERLGEKSLKCVTFHKLAIDIIASSTHEKPTITDSGFSYNVFRELLDTDPKFKEGIATYILESRYKMRDMFEYNTREEYVKDRKTNGIAASFTDMYGHNVMCKSDQESKICDYLGSRGIPFLYEASYEHKTVDEQHRQYKPDFTIFYKDKDGSQKRLYLEHFAVNEKGRTPKWFGEEGEKKYLSGIRWKRQLHKDKGTILIETTSADFNRGNVYDVLESQLRKYGVRPSKESAAEIASMVSSSEKSIIDMLTSFNFLMKSRLKDIEQVKSQVLIGQDRYTINNIVAPFVYAYNAKERQEEVIDFTDTIIRATLLCENGHRQDFDYILVDEFQDISLDRYKFLQSLRRPFPLTKIFCVGDDWQSIYRFAGSDMALFKSFEKFFGYTKECRMETTYRFGEPAIEESSKFILENPIQKSKTVRPFREDIKTGITCIATIGSNDQALKIQGVIDSIPEDESIYVLGRYSRDVYSLNDEHFAIVDNGYNTIVRYNGRDIPFMTVHSSKGLESDNVIILNCNSGTMGFPSNIDDSPILKYVLSSPDGHEYGEERRLFYVGITRAKKHTYVFFDKDKPSTFIKEFNTDIIEGESKSLVQENIPEELLCPVCKCGKIEETFRGKAKNGNPYFIYICSNQPYGCDYREVKFVNLNRDRNKQAR